MFETPCNSPQDVTPGDTVRLHNTHALAGHGLFVVDKVLGDAVRIHDAQNRRHAVLFDHIECVISEDRRPPGKAH